MRRFTFLIILAALLAPMVLLRAEQSQSDARKAQYLNIEAGNAQLNQNYEQALRLTRRAHALAPADTDIGYNLSLLEVAFVGYFSPEGRRQAEERLEGYMTANPADERYAVALHNIYKNTGDTANYIRVLRTAYNFKPTDPDWAMAYARAEMYLGSDSNHVDRAFDIMRRLEAEVYPQDINNPASWSIFESYKDLERYDDAHRQLRRIYNRAPRDIDMLSRMAAGMRGIEMPDSSLYYLEQIKKIEPDFDQLPLLYLSHYNDMNDMPNFERSLLDVVRAPGIDMQIKEELLEKALPELLVDSIDSSGVVDSSGVNYRLALLAEAVKANPESNKIRGMYIGTLLDNDDNETALRELDELIDRDPSNDRMKQARLALYCQIRPQKQYLQLLKEMRRDDPDKIIYLGIVTGNLMSKGDTVQAMKVLQDVDPAEMSSDSIRSVYYMTVGDFAFEGKDTDLTLRSYQRALELDSTNYMAANNLAYRYSTGGDPSKLAEAERLARISIDQGGANSSNLDTYAWIKYQQGDYIAAAENMLRAFEADGALQALANITKQVEQSDYNILAMETKDYSQSAFAKEPISESTKEFYDKKLEKVRTAVEFMRLNDLSDAEAKSMATLLGHAADIQTKLGMAETAYWFRLMVDLLNEPQFTEIVVTEDE